MSMRRDRQASPAQVRGLPRTLLLAASAALVLLVMLPFAAIALRGLPTLSTALQSEAAGQAVRLTAVTSTLALLVIVLLGTPAAWLIARRQIRGWRVIDAVLDLPVVLPPSVAGIGLLIAFGRASLIGGYFNALGIQIAFSTAAVVIAQVFVAAPLYVRAAVIGLRRVDEDMESVAMVEGASTWQVFRYVTLPLSFTALLTGAVLAWARALGEFGATILFAGNLAGRTQTMALAIYIEFQNNIDVALALALMLMLVTLIVLLVVRMIGRTQA